MSAVRVIPYLLVVIFLNADNFTCENYRTVEKSGFTVYYVVHFFNEKDVAFSCFFRHRGSVQAHCPDKYKYNFGTHGLLELLKKEAIGICCRSEQLTKFYQKFSFHCHDDENTDFITNHFGGLNEQMLSQMSATVLEFYSENLQEEHFSTGSSTTLYTSTLLTKIEVDSKSSTMKSVTAKSTFMKVAPYAIPVLLLVLVAVCVVVVVRCCKNKKGKKEMHVGLVESQTTTSGNLVEQPKKIKKRIRPLRPVVQKHAKPAPIQHAQINLKEYQDRGNLKLSAGVRPENLKRHETDAEISRSLKDCYFDPNLNEIWHIGTSRETVEQSASIKQNTNDGEPKKVAENEVTSNPTVKN